MSIRPSQRAMMVGPLDAKTCSVRMHLTDDQNVKVNLMACCSSQKFEMCVKQGEDRFFNLINATDASLLGATEITFRVWEKNKNGALLISYSLSGGQITTPDDDTARFQLYDVTTEALSAGRHHCELWATSSAGYELGAIGRLTVTETRKDG